MDYFQSKIYKYIKQSHRSRWKDLEFKNSCEVFEPGTILSVVYFAENYTFSPQREIQSEYYHSDQVSYMYCIDMLRQALMVGIALLSHAT